MTFDHLLDAIIGPREHFHDMECHICGYDEIFFLHPVTKKQIGVACIGCNFVMKFDN
ncbi:acyltransferase [Domibacillus epiphyticus]|uniref:Acyltransferase n=1 Tax=Domibacillus epiphyticus TaxID=1714355 RepID=A0A1V2ACQ1_9BACI|nr:acyltransferase [Domibacillus epiphyticus]OMP68768.1 acyltransferase [Domibacillus epiphyticus]